MKCLFLLLATLVGSTFAQYDPLFDDGHYGIVHLFEWTWDQIADECEQFLGPRKFGGVQISPPTENRMVETDVGRPWWERYQPVAYDFVTRSGDRDALQDMVSRCNAVGVRIYADLVVNHMCGEGGTGVGTGGTYFDADDGSLSFPGVPFGENDFHADCDINDYSNAANVKDCRLVGLLDIDQSTDYVRGQIIDLMNDMISLGIAGFRVDAAKHMWVSDLTVIFESTNNVIVPGKSGQRPFIYQEVIDNGGSNEAVTADQYVGIGTVTEFKYGDDVATNVVPSKFTYLKDLGTSWGLIDSSDALVFINNHDNQRGHGGAGDPITFWEPLDLKILTAYMMAYDYGIPRIMSSYYYTDTDQGPPATAPPQYSTSDRKYDCGGENQFEWVCEHRWFPMRNLAEFGAISQESPITNKYSPNADSMCLIRGDKSLMCLNNGDTDDLYVNPSTSLSDGCYCNLYNTDKEDCFDQITVSGGAISTTITPKNGVMIHANAMCPSDEGYDSCSDCSCDLDTRVDCGYEGINQQQCQDDGCNWCAVSSSTENIPYCFYK